MKNRVNKIIAYFKKQNVKLIVIACNTATVAGIEAYRDAHPEIPVIGVVPVVKTAAKVSAIHSFAVLSTQYTAESHYQKDLIKKYASHCKVYNLGCKNLVSYVEKGMLSNKEIHQELTRLLSQIHKDIDVLALGCTHYPFLKEAIRAIVGKDVSLLDSGDAVARHVARVLTKRDELSKSNQAKQLFFTTRHKKTVEKVARLLLHQNVSFRYVNI